MLTKGIIITKLVDDNHYLVRIPVLENSEGLQSKFEATLAHVPGIVESYKENDVVIIGFEDHSPYKPIILGKLFINGDNEARGSAKFDSLEVDNVASLPDNINIGGKEFNNFSQMIEYLFDTRGSGGSGPGPTTYAMIGYTIEPEEN